MTGEQDKESNSKKNLNEDDGLWKNETKNIKPLKAKNKYLDLPSEKAEKNGPHVTRKAEKKSLPESPPAPPTNRESIYQTDRRTEQRLKRGEIKIEGRLDLHGKNRLDAHESLVDFILKAYEQGKKCVLVITGKGDQRESADDYENLRGIIRQNFPQWTRSPPLNTLILKIHEARPKHGGKGAFYVLLRKKRMK